jgi:CTP synthase (UTP-ammonia lyase)
MEEAGLKATGVNPDTNLVEIVELKDHPVVYWGAISSRTKEHCAQSTSAVCQVCGGGYESIRKFS